MPSTTPTIQSHPSSPSTHTHVYLHTKHRAFCFYQILKVIYTAVDVAKSQMVDLFEANKILESIAFP